MKELIINLGADDRGAQTFLKLLELGAQPVSVIARYMNVPRPTMYLILEELRKIGLVEEFDRNQMKYFKCIPVSNLEDLIEVRRADLQRTEGLLESNLSDLKKLESKLSITPRVRFFEGKESVMKMYEEVCKQKKIAAYFNPHLVKKIMPEYFYKVAEMIRANRGSAREILVYCSEADEYFDKFHTKTHQIKVLSKGILFKSDTIIVEDKVYMISYGEKDVSAVEIYNKSLAETQRVVFDQWWDML